MVEKLVKLTENLFLIILANLFHYLIKTQSDQNDTQKLLINSLQKYAYKPIKTPPFSLAMYRINVENLSPKPHENPTP